MYKKYLMLLFPCVLTACAATLDAPDNHKQQTHAHIARYPVKKFKHKIAIGQLSNETRYGNAGADSHVNANQDNLGTQTAQKLAARLTRSNKFVVLERPDLAEQTTLQDSNLKGIDTLIVGSVVESQKNTTTKSESSGTKTVQTVRAKIKLHLIDVKTGDMFFTVTGRGEASTESVESKELDKEFESETGDDDKTLSNRAITAALKGLHTILVAKLKERPWSTDIIKVKGQQVFIAGGKYQGIEPGDILAVMQQEEDSLNSSYHSGVLVTPQPSVIGKIRVVSVFGDNKSDEGAITELITGTALANPEDSDNSVFISTLKE